jgi:hypothetical protein
MNFTTGLHTNMPAPDYHAIDALSASGAKHLLRSPAHYLAQKESPMQPTAAMRLGTAVHTMILEPEKADIEIARAPKVDKRTKVGKETIELFERENAGKLCLDADVYDKAAAIADAVYKHPTARELLKDGQSEVSMLWKSYGDTPCKARFDYYRGDGIVDIKTTQDASPEAFARSIASLKYHMQAAHYLQGYREVTGWDADHFTFIAVENEPPYAIGIYRLDEASLQTGRMLMEKAAMAFRTAADPAQWKGYRQDIETISVPSWALLDPSW